MRHLEVLGGRSFFQIVAGTARSQAATMVLQPGEATGGEENVHPDSDQWLYVISGTGAAVVGGRRVRLAPGALLLIEAGETHEVRNDDAEPFVTVNVYAPRAY